jgi:hypothetical protein
MTLYREFLNHTCTRCIVLSGLLALVDPVRQQTAFTGEHSVNECIAKERRSMLGYAGVPQSKYI